MKKMKKLMALLVAMVMAMAMGISVLAATYDKGSIVVNNAAQGETYYAVKALDATISDDGIAYKEPIPTELEAVIEVKTANGVQFIDKKDNVTDEQWQAAMRAFATAHMPTSGGIECTGNSVTFSDLDPGYYVIISTLNDKATNKVSAGSTYDKDAAEGSRNIGQVYEKNETIVVVDKKVKDKSYSIGETIEYTVTFNGANYEGAGSSSKIITKYEVKDTLPDFLSDATVTKVKIGDTEYSGDTGLTEANFPGITTFNTGKKFDIAWATGNATDGWVSKYPNGTAIEITYTAVLTKIVNVNADNTNTIIITPYPEGEPSKEPYEDKEKITTYAAALKKVDDKDKTLAGAKFKFKGLELEETVSGTVGVYNVVSYDPNGADGSGTEVEVGSDGMLYIVGLKEGLELKGKETVPPKGYNLLTDEITLSPQVMTTEIYSTSGMRYYDADGNLVKETASYESSKEVTNNLATLEPKAVKVINKAGTELPSTGGMGTTILYILGTILVLGAGLTLITKRRMSAK